MKLFLKKTLVFIGSFYGGAGLLMLGTNGIVRSQADFKLKPETNKIVIGNSHPAGTFNDSLIANFKNLADPGDSYFYGYQKLKELIKRNPQLDTVFVEFNPKTILLWEDSKLWKKHQIPNYMPFFEREDHLMLLQDNGLSYQQEVFKGLLKNIQHIVSQQYPKLDVLGGFRHVTSTRLDAILDTVSYDPQQQFRQDHITLSVLDVKYLKKMTQLCAEHQVRMVFVRSPYHKMFDGRRYETIFQAYRKAHFDTIPFLDFKDFPATDAEFKDLEHLNHLGARRFSLWFDEQIVTQQ